MRDPYMDLYIQFTVYIQYIHTYVGGAGPFERDVQRAREASREREREKCRESRQRVAERQRAGRKRESRQREREREQRLPWCCTWCCTPTGAVNQKTQLKTIWIFVIEKPYEFLNLILSSVDWNDETLPAKYGAASGPEGCARKKCVCKHAHVWSN